MLTTMNNSLSTTTGSLCTLRGAAATVRVPLRRPAVFGAARSPRVGRRFVAYEAAGAAADVGGTGESGAAETQRDIACEASAELSGPFAFAAADEGASLGVLEETIADDVLPVEVIELNAQAHTVVLDPAEAEAETRAAKLAAATKEVEAKEDASLGELLAFAGPTAALWLISPLMSLVDTAIVGSQSAVALAALAPGTVLCDYSSYVFTFIAVATTNLVAAALAKGDIRETGACLSDGMAMGAFCGAVFGAALYWLAPMYLQAVAGSKAPELIPLALDYVLIRAVAMPAVLLAQVTQAYFLAAKSPKIPLLATLSAGLINLAGDLILVNGCGMGIQGAAIATAGAQIATAGALVWALNRPLPKDTSHEGLVVPWSWRMPTLERAGRFVSVAGPAGSVLITKVVTYCCLNSTATSMGAVAAAAHHVVWSLFDFFNTIGEGVSQISQAYLPGLVGRPAPAWAMARKIFITGVVLAVLQAALSAGTLAGAAHLFTRSPAVLSALAPLVPVLLAVQLLCMTSLVTEGMLFAGRQQGFLMRAYATIVGSVYFVVTAGLHRGMGLGAVWAGVLALQVMRMAVNSYALLREKSFLNSETPLEVAAP